MRLLVWVFFCVFFLGSCDCMQIVKGVILDKDTNKPLSNIRIYSKTKKHIETFTDSMGLFELHSISGGFRCPPMDVVVESGGAYETKEVSIPAGGFKEIKLELLSLVVEGSNIAHIPFDTTMQRLFKNCIPSGLSYNELCRIEPILIKCIDEYNEEAEKRFNKMVQEHPEYRVDKRYFVIDLKRYKRQYVTVTNKKGEKEVWINCLCNVEGDNWKKGIIQVLDGGNCYFNVKINLTKRHYYDLMVNGEA